MPSLTWVLSSCILILVVVALRAVFGKRIKLSVRYVLWGLVLLRLLVPFEIGGSAFSVASAVERAELPEASETVVAWRNISVSPDLSIPEPDPSLPEPEQRAQYETNRAEWEAQIAEPRAVEATPVTVTDVLRWVWYAGMAATAAVFLVSNLRFYFRLRKRRVLLDTDCKLKVYSVENLSSSCLFLNSVYVSAGTAEDSLKLRHVLAHEMAHWRHGDGAWSLLRCAALALHWYNPLAWWAAALSRRDSELFADEGALKSLGDAERQSYGVTLIELSARHPASASLLCTATTMTDGKKALKERVVRIAKQPRAKLWAVVIVALVAALAVGCTLMGAAEAKETDGGAVDVLILSTPDAVYTTDSSRHPEEIARLWELFRTMENAQGDTAPDPDALDAYAPLDVDFRLATGQYASIRLWGPYLVVLDEVDGVTRYYEVTDGEAVYAAFWEVYQLLAPAPAEAAEAPASASDLLPSPAVRLDAGIGDGVPQAAVDWALEAAQRDVEFQTMLGAEGLSGNYRVVDAKLTELSPVNTGTAGIGSSILMYRPAWRILVDRPENVLLAGGMSMEDGWITEQGSTGSPYLILAVYDDGGAERWERVTRISELTIQEEYATPEMLARYDDNPYIAACVEEHAKWLERYGGLTYPNGFSMPIDIDHDGTQEQAVVREVRRDGYPQGVTVSVEDADGTVLWYGALETAHAGWGSIFKYVDPADGRDYLLAYQPNYSTGYGVYEYKVFDPAWPVMSGIIEFSIARGALNLDGEAMAAFAEEVNRLLEHSTLLASTDGGTVVLGPGSAVPYYEDYHVFLDDGSVTYPEGLTLAEKIEYYEDVQRLSSIRAARDYAAANELTDAEFAALLRDTDGLDGAFAEAYDEVLSALWQRDRARYLRLWTGLTEAQQDRAIPWYEVYELYEVVNSSDGPVAAAREWMIEQANAALYASFGPDAVGFARGRLLLGVSHVTDTEQASGVGDGGGRIVYTVFHCGPGAAVTVANADMFTTSAGTLHPSWAFYDAEFSNRVDIVDGMEPVPVTETLYVCSTESGDRVLAIVPEG